MPDAPTAFYLALEDEPHDAVTLQALADWYDDQGDADAAACLRWAVRRGLGPYRYRKGAGLTIASEGWHDGWLWWATDDPDFGRDWGHPPSCRLPSAVWKRLRHTFGYPPAVFKEYPTSREAYEALIDAWARVRPDALEAAGRERP